MNWPERVIVDRKNEKKKVSAGKGVGDEAKINVGT
jgi:hypothetical protein